MEVWLNLKSLQNLLIESNYAAEILELEFYKTFTLPSFLPFMTFLCRCHVVFQT